jgi:hypothetical protein
VNNDVQKDFIFILDIIKVVIIYIAIESEAVVKWIGVEAA